MNKKEELLERVGAARGAEGASCDTPIIIPLEEALAVIAEEFRPEIFRFQVPGLDHSMALMRPKGYGCVAILVKKPDDCRHLSRCSNYSVRISLLDERDKKLVPLCYSISCLCACCWRDLWVDPDEENWNQSISVAKGELFSEAILSECQQRNICTLLIGLPRSGKPVIERPCPGVIWKRLPVDYRLVVSQFSKDEGIFVESWN